MKIIFLLIIMACALVAAYLLHMHQWAGVLFLVLAFGFTGQMAVLFREELGYDRE